jgi:hypothetical protein
MNLLKLLHWVRAKMFLLLRRGQLRKNAIIS